MDYTHQEILRQPTTWGKTLNYLQEKESYFSQFLAETHDNVIFTGCGSSYNLSLVASLFWLAGKQVPAKGVPASETFLFPEGVFLPQTSISSLVFLAQEKLQRQSRLFSTSKISSEENCRDKLRRKFFSFKSSRL